MFELSEQDIEVGCITLERQRIVDGVPIFYDISYLPNINLPRFTRKSFENRSLFNILRTSYGIEVIGGEQKIRAVKADENLSRYLDVKTGDPVLHLQRKMKTNRFGYFFYSSIYCNTEEFYLEGTF
jgi:GntR family transcriptional regulator/GntR family frlABCD operon transcriptional regulator